MSKAFHEQDPRVFFYAVFAYDFYFSLVADIAE